MLDVDLDILQYAKSSKIEKMRRVDIRLYLLV